MSKIHVDGEVVSCKCGWTDTKVYYYDAVRSWSNHYRADCPLRVIIEDGSGTQEDRTPGWRRKTVANEDRQ